MKAYSSHISNLLKLGWPVIMAQLGQITVGLVDNMMIGQLGTSPLAAASFTNTVFNSVLIFGMGFTFTLTPQVGEALGKNAPNRAVESLKNSLLTNMGMGLLLFALLVMLNLNMDQFGQPAGIIEASRQYLAILTLSFIPQMIFLTFKQFFEGVGDTKSGMRITLWGNVVNIVGNFIFINGWFGMPAMGLLGAGVGTLISRIFMASLAAWKFGRSNSYGAYASLFPKVSLSMSRIKFFWWNGWPLALQMLTEASAFGVAAIMMGWISEVGLAAHQVAISISTLGFMVYQGIGAAAGIEISKYYGKEDLPNMKRSAYAALMIILVMSTGMVLFFLLGRYWLADLFTDDQEVILLVNVFLFWLAAFQIPDGIQIVYAGVLRGVQDFKFPLWLTFSAYFIISLPFSYWAAFHGGFGEVGIWMGFPLGLSISSTLFLIRFEYLRRKRLVTKSEVSRAAVLA
ncbi:MATE family efflux transporter [Persicobacter diffluens]|uniref:Multidrug-efflux transporter n=1 Tax=Persicobacter diffluens TaxID=981 RepID=A0AAN4W0B3_9BACT|nr:MATE family efflux transporter [Persicobacter diffluens]